MKIIPIPSFLSSDFLLLEQQLIKEIFDSLAIPEHFLKIKKMSATETKLLNFTPSQEQ